MQSSDALYTIMHFSSVQLQFSKIRYSAVKRGELMYSAVGYRKRDHTKTTYVTASFNLHIWLM